MSDKKPTHTAYVVTPGKEGTNRDFWHDCGVVWPHKDGSGFDLVIHPGMAVHGRVILREPKEKEPKQG